MVIPSCFRAALACRGVSVKSCWALAWLLLAPAAMAQVAQQLVEETYGKGHGSIRLATQAMNMDYFRIEGESYEIGEVDLYSFDLQLDYAVGDRWILELGLPWIKKRYQGPYPESPAGMVPPFNQAPYLDDGSFHAGFQDWLVGVRYLLDTRPVQLEPFIHATIPSGDYSHFGWSSIGQDIWHLELGMELTHIMPFSNWYYRMDAAYVIVEQTLGHNQNYFVGSGELGYFLRPNLNVHVQVRMRDGQGSSGPYPDRTGEEWYYHGRFGYHSTGNWGIGADWLVVDHWQLSGSAYRSFWGKTVLLVDWGVTMAVTRHF